MGLRLRLPAFVRPRAHAALLLASIALLLTSPGRAAVPTDQEQLFVYELNRARHDPPAWAQEVGIDNQTGGDGQPADLMEVAPRPPLALNENLVGSARFHAEEMAANDYFAHQSAVTGDWPNKMARDAGYPLPMMVPSNGSFFLFPDDSNQIESIAGGFGPGPQDLTQAINALILLIVDEGVPSLGHRRHLLATDEFNALFNEVGTGYGSSSSFLRNYWALHTGVQADPETYLTGVVYDDGNENELYDAGEGLGGVTVMAGGASTLSNAAGGWSLAVPDGVLQVGCSGGGFVGSGAAAVTVSGVNREVDCISGFAGAIVDFVPVPEPAAGLLRGFGLAGVALLSWCTRGRRPSG